MRAFIIYSLLKPKAFDLIRRSGALGHPFSCLRLMETPPLSLSLSFKIYKWLAFYVQSAGRQPIASFQSF